MIREIKLHKKFIGHVFEDYNLGFMVPYYTRGGEMRNIFEFRSDIHNTYRTYYDIGPRKL